MFPTGYALILLWAALCGLGAVQVQEGMLGQYPWPGGGRPGQAAETAMGSGIYLCTAWLIGGLACGAFALAFPALGPPGLRRRGGW